MPGLGHPVHKVRDPRTPALLAIAEEEGLRGNASTKSTLSPAVVTFGAVPWLRKDAGVAGVSAPAGAATPADDAARTARVKE